MRTIFSDKATVVIRAMLAQPDKKWVVRDYESEFGVGRARAAAVLSILRKKGFVGGISSGRLAHSVLQNRKSLLDEWLKFYSFELNKAYLYYSPHEDILSRLKDYFEAKKNSFGYALALHTGANLITNYVHTQAVYCYLRSEKFSQVSLDLRQALDLKELKNGGNFYLIKPYYKNGVFFNNQNIKGYNVVSDLQLYLDLYNFPQRGREHAQYLLKTLKEEGKSFVNDAR
jgi:hypothetical protein